MNEDEIYRSFDGGVADVLRTLEKKICDRLPVGESDSASEAVMDKTEDAIKTIQTLGRALVEDTSLMMGQTAVDALALTLLQIHASKAYGGGLQSEHMDRLAKILVGQDG